MVWEPIPEKDRHTDRQTDTHTHMWILWYKIAREVSLSTSYTSRLGSIHWERIMNTLDQ